MHASLHREADSLNDKYSMEGEDLADLEPDGDYSDYDGFDPDTFAFYPDPF